MMRFALRVATYWLGGLSGPGYFDGNLACLRESLFMTAPREGRAIDWTRAVAGIVIATAGAVAFVCLPLEGSASLPPAIAHFGIGLGGMMVFIGIVLVAAAVPER